MVLLPTPSSEVGTWPGHATQARVSIAWNPFSERVAFYTHPPTITNLTSIGGNHQVTRQRFSFIDHHRVFIDVFPRTDKVAETTSTIG